MLRILIADSYRDSANSMALLLQLYGHECAVAYSGDEAIELGLTFCPDVALLELALTGTDGLEVARQLRQYGILPIALTGYGDRLHRQQAAEAGFLFYFLKPVDPEQLDMVLGASDTDLLERTCADQEEVLCMT